MVEQTELSDLPSLQAYLDRVSQGGRVTVVGVTGHAGAGKTTLCNRLISKAPNRFLRLECDRFSAHSYAERSARINRAQTSGDAQAMVVEENPLNWYDWQEILRVIRCLRADHSFETDRAWNPSTGELDASYTLSVDHKDPAIVLCDCIYLLHAPVRAQFDCVLRVECDVERLLKRRKQRAKDKQAEGAARERYERFERPYFDAFRDSADAVYVDRGL